MSALRITVNQRHAVRKNWPPPAFNLQKPRSLCPVRDWADVLTMTDLRRIAITAPHRKWSRFYSHLRCLGKFKSVLNVDAEITHGVLDLSVAKQNLDGTQVSGRLVDD